MDTYLNLLTAVMANIEKTVFQGALRMEEPLFDLLFILATIDIATKWEMYFSPESWNWGNLFIKVIGIGFSAFLIRNWVMILTMCKQSGEQLGLAFGNADAVMTPTQVISIGIGNTFKVMGQLCSNMPPIWDGSSFFTTLLAIVALFFALYAFGKIAFTLFNVNAQFLILGTLSMVCLPFSACKYTKSIGEKPWGILFTGVVKIMVATFMICLLANEITQLFASTENLDTNLANIITSSVSIIFLSFLFNQAIEYAGAAAQGLSINSPNLVSSAGSMAAGYAGGVAGRFAMRKAGQAAGYAGRKAGQAVGYAGEKAGQAVGYAAQKAGQAARYWWDKYQ